MAGTPPPARLVLGTPAGTDLPVVLDRVRWRTSAGVRELRAVFVLDAAGYARTCDEALFHLEPAARLAGHAIAFDRDAPVEVEARLAADLMSLAPPPATEEALRAALVALPERSPRHPLLRCDAWYALSVVQALPLPPELRETGGAVKRGYRTVWAGAPPPAVAPEGPPPAPPGAAMLFDVITAFAQDSGWPFEVVEPGSMLRLALKGEHGSWTTVIMADAEFDQCVVFSYLTEEVRPARRAAVAEFLTRANYGLRVGNFEMDFEDGEVRFRTSVDLAGETLAPAMLKQLVSHNALQFDRYLPGLEAVLQGAAPAAAVRMVEDAPA